MEVVAGALVEEQGSVAEEVSRAHLIVSGAPPEVLSFMLDNNHTSGKREV